MALPTARNADPDPRFHLVVIPPPPEKVTQIMAAQLANKLGGDRHRARQWLLARTPRVVKGYINSQQALPECEEIRALGVTALVARHEDLLSGPAPLVTRRVEFTAEGIVLTDRDINEIILDAGRPYGVVQFRRAVKPARPGDHDPKNTAATGLKDFGLGASRLGFDPKIRVAGGRFDEEIEAGLMIFDERPHPLVEISQLGMVYDWLGEEKAKTASANFTKLLERLRASLPRARWDDRLMNLSLAPPGPLDRHRILCEMAGLPLENLTARLLMMAHRAFPPAENPES